MWFNLLLLFLVHFSKFPQLLFDAAVMILEGPHEQIHVFESVVGYLLLWLVFFFHFKNTVLDFGLIETTLCRV